MVYEIQRCLKRRVVIVSKFKSLISNLYNRYMDEMDDYEELEDEYEEQDLEAEAEYKARRAEKEARRQMREMEMMAESSVVHPHLEEDEGEDVRPFEGTILTSKTALYDYTKESKVCCHCDSSLDKGLISAKDQWGMSYVICPSCQFVNRMEPTGECVYPSSEMAEMEHALALFAQKGYVFKGFNAKEEEPSKQAAAL